ncbi:MAG: DnaJ domain-containing protein [Polyangia bacterium]
MSELAVATVSVTPTARRRWFWAAWWTGAPTEKPFRKPDASNGGATSLEAALRAAEKVAARTLAPIDARWARAWSRVLRELPPWPSSPSSEPKQPKPAAHASVWSHLGLTSKATMLEVKQAYRRLALETHPDHGGDAGAFRALNAAYEAALARVIKKRR